MYHLQKAINIENFSYSYILIFFATESKNYLSKYIKINLIIKKYVKNLIIQTELFLESRDNRK